MNEKELETLVPRMEFGLEKCAMPVTNSGKRPLTDRMELPNQEKIRSLRKKETY